MSSNHSELKKHVEAGAKRFAIMFLYLLAMITLFRLQEYVILREHNIPYGHLGVGVVKALVLAKVMLIADELKLGRRLGEQPLIYSVLGRSALFAVAFIAFDFLEQIVVALFSGKDIAGSISDPGGSMAASVVLGAIMCVMLIPYFAFAELGRVFGVRNVGLFLFSPPRTRGIEKRAVITGT